MARFLAALGAAFLLSACASSGGGVFNTVAKETGETLCGTGYADADARNTRVLYLGAAAVVVAELGADRVTRYEPDDAAYVHGLIVTLQSELTRLRSRVSVNYFHADLYDVERLLVLSVERAARRQIDLADFTGAGIGTVAGVAVGGPVGAAGAAAAVTASNKFLSVVDSPTARLAAGQAFKLSALRADMQGFMAKVRADELTVDEGWAIVTDRLGYNQQRVTALVTGQ